MAPGRATCKAKVKNLLLMAGGWTGCFKRSASCDRECKRACNFESAFASAFGLEFDFAGAGAEMERVGACGGGMSPSIPL